MGQSHLKVKVAFNINNDPALAKLSRSVRSGFSCGTAYTTYLDHGATPPCDVFVSGAAVPARPSWARFPCKSLLDICGFSVTSSLHYIQRRRPKLVVFDDLDVRVCLLPHARAPVEIKRALERCGYSVEMAVIATGQHGTPLSRHLLCIVAIRLDAEVEPFKFPAPIYQVPELKHFLRHSTTRPFMRFVPGALAKQVCQLYPLSINGGGMRLSWRIISPFSTHKFKQMMMVGMLPFTLAELAGDLFLSVHEVGALHGLPAQTVTAMLAALDGDRATLGNVLAEAMPVNVSMRILLKALYCAGLVSAPLPDHWASAPTIMTGASSALKLPEALYSTFAQPALPLIC